MATFTIQPVALADISKDGYQRPLKESQRDAIVNGFDPAQWNLPKVVAKNGGGFRVVAGQHRIEAARALARTPKRWPFTSPLGVIDCQVIGGFTSIEEEAHLFLNDDKNTRRLSTFDKHTAGLVANVQRAVDVQRALDAHGITLVHKQRRENGKTMVALGALNNVWNAGAYQLLDETLAVVAAWPEADPKRTGGYLFGGLAVVIAEKISSGTWDRAKAIRRLSATKHWPTNLWGEAMKIAADTGVAPNSYRPFASAVRKVIG